MNMFGLVWIQDISDILAGCSKQSLCKYRITFTAIQQRNVQITEQIKQPTLSWLNINKPS